MGHWAGVWAVLLLIVAGCGAAEVSQAPAPEAGARTDRASLRLEIQGLPSSAQAHLILYTPEGLRQHLQGSQTLSDMAPGRYRLEGLDILQNGQIYSPQPHPQLSLQAQQTLETQVVYRGVQGIQAQIFTPTLEAKFVEGQALVKWRGGSSQVGAQLVGRGAVELLKMPTGEIEAQGVTAASTLEWIAELRQRPEVEYAEPNYWRFPTQAQGLPQSLLHDPEQASNMWATQQLNLEAAWQQTQGSSAVTVAVLDSGIHWRPNDPAATHPDLACGRVLPGYDFVSYLENGDGDGRDPDPYPAPGDDHGTQVAGIIGACSDNGLGLTGTDSKARILPVRVLGRLGGTDIDIIAGLRWAAGLPVAGVPTNPNPAKVINLSLSGLGVNRLMDEAILEVVRERNAIVIAAAGNDNDQSLRYSPAGSEAVIAVGATNAQRQKAAFSNYGAGVRVLAPGQNILSLSASGQSFGYRSSSGTSFAAPYISAIVALMVALKPDLSWVEASTYLSRSASSIPSCVACGGLVDAGKAVALAARREAVGAFVSPAARVDLGSHSSASFTLRNYGDQPAQLSAPAIAGLGFSPQSATLAPGAEQLFTLSLSSAESGRYYRVLELGQTHLLLSYQRGNGIANLGMVQVALCQGRGGNVRLIRGAAATFENSYRFGVGLEGVSGSDLFLRAWVDKNGDGVSEFASGRVYFDLGFPAPNLILEQHEQPMNEGGCVVNL